MIFCPFTDKVCMIHSAEDKQCMFEILPHTEKKPLGQNECALKDAVLMYIKEKRPEVKF